MVKYFSLVVSALFSVAALSQIAIHVYQDEHTLNNCDKQEFYYQTKKLEKLVSPIADYSDHELMVITNAHCGTVLSYNIGEQYWGSDSKFINNAFGIKLEEEHAYRNRLSRIFARIRKAQQETNADVILLQEYMDPAQEIVNAPNLFEEFPDFTITRTSKNVTLVKKHLPSMTMDLDLSYASKNGNRIIVTMLETGIVINQHSSWQPKLTEDARPDVINDFNAVFARIAEKISADKNNAVLIAGDWNREDYDVLDEQRTISIDDFAKRLKLNEMTLAKAGVYTNLRDIKNSNEETITGVLTASDYAVQGFVRGSAEK